MQISNFVIKEENGCESNTEKSSVAEIDEHIPCRYSISTIWTFDNIENNENACRGEYCIKKFC